MSGTNPFAALFNDDKSRQSPSIVLNDVLEIIFGFTINPKHASEDRIFLEEVKSVHEKTELELSLLNYALFERLFMCNENSGLNNRHETRVLNYLYSCSKRLDEFKGKLKVEDEVEIRDKIMQNIATAIIQPDIYSGQNIAVEMVDILKGNESGADVFFYEAAKKVVGDDNFREETLRNFIGSMNTPVLTEIMQSSLSDLNHAVFTYFTTLVSNEVTAELFVDSCFPPRDREVGSDYALTPIGALLNISVLPKNPDGKHEYFTNPMDPTSNSCTEDYLWGHLAKLNQSIHQLFLTMLRSGPKVKNKALAWLGNCLKQNSARGKLWNTHAPQLNPAIYTSVTDGFMINMGNLLLRLCQPLCSKTKDEKILKVDPTYCAVKNEQTQKKNVNLKDMSEETCFLPANPTDDAEEERLTADSYSFVTECFYMAHRAVDLGCRVGVDKLLRQNIEMARIERAFNDALQQAGGNSDLVGTIKDRMSEELTKYLSLKCTLSDPELLQIMFDFVSGTSYWLCQVSVRFDFKDASGYAPLNELPIKFPLPDKVPNTLKCIPEFIVENTVSFLVFVRHFTPRTFEVQGFEKLSPIFTFILIYMGSPLHLRNPHIRARLAEGLESLLPFHKEESPGLNNLGGGQRQKLFVEHAHRLEVAESLMKVFVGIEMTGQSVEFEQKFNYRRPMYAIFDYVWELEEHMDRFNYLATEAEKNMEAVNPPLFLRFVNLLINDAIFLLDEALANMAKLKEMQQAQDNGEWANVNPRERAQNIGYMHHIGNLARFDNILGKDTIKTLEKLTSRIMTVFTHSTIVDRIAAMLNYFLLNLVGPNKKNFKVKDAKEYRFDPAGTVLEICKIYVNLKGSDSFCLAVSQDGRSYSPTLFPLAEDVLIRIGGGSLIGELKEVADKVAAKAEESQATEEALSEAPEHFLDPIMSTIMRDPVVLPSSKQTVDRSTIARHLLSDQTDPFNRSPLSMDQVTSNTELAEEIKRWIEERKKK